MQVCFRSGGGTGLSDLADGRYECFGDQKAHVEPMDAISTPRYSYGFE